ncbi:inhibitor of nuclear factor kappa-B kinase subunit epsilon isoform X2 [Ambystoma mexicanum]
MNHLRENGIVHRDIKPGNIMRLVGEDGQSIYKLTDFGAARELGDEEKFVSIYGTEEYLHPDMYERAVLRKPLQKVYGVTVDLWSIGVTFYHAAAGSLPFIPYGGPRKNKEIMHRITTEKPPGAIAGIQRRENGPIEWIYNLPITCRLSTGLKGQLVAVLGNILEVDQEKCWVFDQFFAETNDILHRIVIHVFSLQQASLHSIYIHTYNTAAIFLDEVFKQTGIKPEHQEYYFDGHRHPLKESLPAQQFCKTSPHNPLILVSSEPEALVGVIYRDPALDFPSFIPSVDVMADCITAKNVLSAVHQTLRVSQSLLKCQQFILRGLYWMSEQLKAECSNTLERRSDALAVLSCLQSLEGTTLTLYNSVFGGYEQVPELLDNEDLSQRLKMISDGLSCCFSSIPEKRAVLAAIEGDLLRSREQVHNDQSVQRIENCLERIQLLYKQFKRTRQQPRLMYNDEQIHKLDKVNLGMLVKKVLSVFQDDCVQKYKTLLSSHSSRTRTLSDIRKHLRQANATITALNAEMVACQCCLNNVLDRFPQRLHQLNLMRPSVPSVPVHLSQTHQDLAQRMLRLRLEMKTVADDLCQNNRVIERISAVSTAPGN